MRGLIGLLLTAAALSTAGAGCGDGGSDQVDVIRNLVDAVYPAGEEVFNWDQKTDSGGAVPPGTYGAWFRSEGFDSTAVFTVVAGDGSLPVAESGERPLAQGYMVWTGSEAYVVGELVDIHVYLPGEGPVNVKIVDL